MTKALIFPDSKISLAGLTDTDLDSLDLVCQLADIIALSFVNNANDILQIKRELAKRKMDYKGVVLKIETVAAIKNLPDLILTAMSLPNIGLMIARGDLGVEAGWRSMAEYQEEILWLCTAAHIPTIWATQVLETYAKTGVPSRAEITDAAMAQRSECVMLNKGPYMTKVIRLLSRIIKTMDKQQYKRSARLPKLDMAELSTIMCK